MVTNPSGKHFDIINLLSRALSLSPLSWTFKHVKGHHDNEVATIDLTNWEYWNTVADREQAKNKLTEISNQHEWSATPLTLPCILPTQMYRCLT